MLQNHAYNQLLSLINARSQHWLRAQIDLLPAIPRPDDAAIDDLAEIAVVARICSGFRGTEAPLQTFVKGRITPEFLESFVAGLPARAATAGTGSALVGLLGLKVPPEARSDATPDLLGRLALCALPDADLLAQAGAFLARPVPDERLSEAVLDRHAGVLALCYRFGAERPRFADIRVYGDAYANVVRFTAWAQRNGRLRSLAQMCFSLCLLDPDHDVTELLADIIASQRPDGSFPARIGFGTADQDRNALRPTLAVLAALHIAIHRRWRQPRSPVPMAA